MTGPGPWIEPAAPPELNPDGVHVWRIPLQAAGLTFDRLWASLSPDERERANRFRRDGDRERFVVGRGTLRERLGGYLGIGAERVAFEYGVHGKPFLVPDGSTSPISFNLAHSGGLALLAVSRGRSLGVDLERSRPLIEADRIVSRYFTGIECRDYESLPASDRPAAFLRGWTRKEAYLKATGEGIAIGLHRVSITMRPGDPPRILHYEGRPDEPSRWNLVDLDPGEGFVGSLAVEGEGVVIDLLRGPIRRPRSVNSGPQAPVSSSPSAPSRGPTPRGTGRPLRGAPRPSRPR